jgi:hypothetical protein
MDARYMDASFPSREGYIRLHEKVFELFSAYVVEENLNGFSAKCYRARERE